MVRPDTTKMRQSLDLNRSRAKEMRHEPVAAEELFWDRVRNRRLGGCKFKRQVLIGSYIADFVCIEKKLIVELDGPFHAKHKGYDAARDAYLKNLGYRVLRFTNDEFASDLPATLLIVQHTLDTAAPSPCPLPQRGRGN
ncbi:MAG: endonuclease domain-containing protein [Rhizobiales bacterium]|nr:endonuclease domain-containing protein [Hyphomicrobiales bacterium]